jgi:hypothetical protein
MENAALEVAQQVRVVEDSIEAALIELAELQTKMVNARVVTNANFVNSHEAFAQLANVTSGLISARGGIGNCHVALAETRRTIPGLRTVSYGDENNCPSKTAEERPDLRIVS